MYKPLHDYVLIRQDEAETRTEGGLWLPECHWLGDVQIKAERPYQGIVLAAGPGRAVTADLRRPMAVAAGDRVLFHRLHGTPFRHKETKEDLLLVLESGLLAKVIEADEGIKVQALGDQILIRVDDAPDTTEGGLVVTDAAKKAVWTGEVIAAGQGAPIYHKRSMSFVRENHAPLVGKRVRWEEGIGYYLQLGDQHCVLVDAKELLCELAA